MTATLKTLNDEQRNEAIDEFVNGSLKDRDNIDFDFEADFKKMMKNLNLRQLIKKNKKYMKRFNNMVMQLYLNSYLKTTIKAGKRQTARFNRLFVDG